MFQEFWIGGLGARENRRHRNGGHQDRHVGASKLREMTLERRAHHVCRDDRGRAKSREICETALVPFIFSLAKIFWDFERQKIMNKKDGLYVRTKFHPVEIIPKPKRELADI